MCRHNEGYSRDRENPRDDAASLRFLLSGLADVGKDCFAYQALLNVVDFAPAALKKSGVDAQEELVDVNFFVVSDR